MQGGQKSLMLPDDDGKTQTLVVMEIRTPKQGQVRGNHGNL